MKASKEQHHHEKNKEHSRQFRHNVVEKFRTGLVYEISEPLKKGSRIENRDGDNNEHLEQMIWLNKTQNKFLTRSQCPKVLSKIKDSKVR